MGHGELDSVRIGNVIRSIRLEKNIPIKVIAKALNVSESTISQFETGKILASDDRCAEIFNACGCDFNFEIDFNDIENLFFSLCDAYTQVNDKDLLGKIENFLKKGNGYYSFGRFEYVLILYLYSIISEKIYIIDSYKLDDIICCGFPSMDIKEKSMYFDFKGTYCLIKNKIKESEEHILKSLELDPYNFMANYHCGIINLKNGYFTIASIYLDSATMGALYLVAIERLIYIMFFKSKILLYTYQFEESFRISLNLLNESIRRKDLFLEKNVKSDIALNYLLQKNYKETIKWVDKIETEYIEEREMLYRVYCLYKLKEFEKCKFFIKIYSEKLHESRHGREFLKGLKYLINDYPEKAISTFELCYKILIDNGEIDRAILDLRILEMLYVQFNCSTKIQNVYKILNNFYKISHSRNKIENIDIKLN